MRRVGIGIALAAFAVMAGTLTGQATVTTELSLPISAAAAEIGIGEQSGLAALAHTYAPDEQTLAVAAAIVVTNTGTRAAEVHLAVWGENASVAALPGAVHVEIGTTSSAGSCTVLGGLADRQTGTLTETAYVGSAALAAGASTTLCVRTSIAESDAEQFGETTVELRARASLRYSDGAAWRAVGTTAQASQHVASVLLFFDDPSGRYSVTLRNAAGTPECVYRVESGGQRLPVRGSACTNWANQWRLSSAGENRWYITEAVNNGGSQSDPRWQGGGSGAAVVSVTPAATSSQQWIILGRGDGTFSVRNVATDLCASLGPAALWNNGPVGLVTAVCDPADQRQAFAFTAVGTPVPPQPFATICSGSAQHLDVAWPQNAGYEAEADYRVLFNGIHVGTQNNGWDPHFRFAPADVSAYASQYGVGVQSVTVQQSVSGSAWSTYAIGSVRLNYVNGTQLRLACS